MSEWLHWFWEPQSLEEEAAKSIIVLTALFWLAITLWCIPTIVSAMRVVWRSRKGPAS